jgi:hypothetical protein
MSGREINCRQPANSLMELGFRISDWISNDIRACDEVSVDPPARSHVGIK